ncbi:hypothetical protein JL720_12140 [Aureococcus anophagefferens]|nr:hypothetical protein JL720_12140 [Aureococcus anophagefferens]
MEVVSIHNRRAAKRGYNVSFFASYVTEAQDELIACNTGYARYVDNHIGVSLGGPDSLSLDANAESLCRNDVGFHNGNDSYDWGSNWCRGASGLGVEFQGNFDWTFFHPELVDPLDYCAKLGSGDSMDFCPYNMTAIASSPERWRRTGCSSRCSRPSRSSAAAPRASSPAAAGAPAAAATPPRGYAL